MTTRLTGQMQPQKAFNRFYQEFVVEGNEQCVDRDIHKGGSCQYRTQQGRGCAIGIQPEFMAIYLPEFEANGIDVLRNAYDEVEAIIHADDLDFFKHLQELHDGGFMVAGGLALTDAVDRLATDYQLTIPKGKGGA